MKSNKKLNILLNEIIGLKVKKTRLAANSLIIYIECEPGDKKGYSIWLEPTWHLTEEKVLLGSRQLQTDNDELFHKFAKILNKIHNLKIINISIIENSNDINILLEKNYSIKTFVADPTDPEIWHITDIKNKLKVYVSPTQFKIVQTKK